MGSVKTVCMVVLFLFCFHKVEAQPYKQLTLNDFEGSPEHNSATVAYTHCYIDLKYDVHARNGYYQLKFNVTLEMNKERSWIDRARINSSDRLEMILNHEQGHYTIAYFEQQELLRTFSKTRFEDDYESAVKKIFNRIHAKYEQLTKDYDDDTNHSQNRAQQESWDKYFLKRLRFMPPS